jgi:hypothetical protein
VGPVERLPLLHFYPPHRFHPVAPPHASLTSNVHPVSRFPSEPPPELHLQDPPYSLFRPSLLVPYPYPRFSHLLPLTSRLRRTPPASPSSPRS